MSIVHCFGCDRDVDTDYEEMDIVKGVDGKEKELCINCSEGEAE